MTFLLAVARALHFAGLMTVFGAAALLLHARGEAASAPLRRPLAVAAGTALVCAIACLFFASAEMTGDTASVGDLRVVSTVVLSTFYGHVAFVRLLLLAGLLLICFRDGWFGTKAAVAGAALALLSLNSHAAASGTSYALHAAVDAAHLVTAGFWTGGLVVLAREVLAAPRDRPRLVALLHRFSRWGAVSVAILLAAGTANGFFILGTPGMRWSGTYVTWLAVKIVLAAVMVALALTNRFGVLPALARGETEADETIPLTVIAELSCAGAILLIVGFLGVVAPMEM